MNRAMKISVAVFAAALLAITAYTLTLRSPAPRPTAFSHCDEFPPTSRVEETMVSHSQYIEQLQSTSIGAEVTLIHPCDNPARALMGIFVPSADTVDSVEDMLTSLPDLKAVSAILLGAPPATEDETEAEESEMTSPVQPAYEWRGIMIDVTRNFLGVDDVMSLMDLAQSVGLNRFHMHLSDDQGWRLEIPGWPELIERSSSTSVRGANSGYYTVSDWRQLQRAAHSRGLLLVPEIDLPGHTNAALHAIEGLNVDGVRPAPYTGMEVGFSSLRIDAPETERFLREVLSHVARESDGYVHIGGDEAHATSKDEYSAIVTMAVDAVHEAGAKVIAWQEAAPLLGEGDLVQLWDDRQDFSAIAEAATRGVGVILSPASYVYFDMKYSDEEELGLTWNRRIELQDTAAWDPLAELGDIPADAVVGVEGALWAETLRSRADYEYMLLPRIAALGEIATRGSIDWDEFAAGLPELARSWDERGWNWHRSPGVEWE
ncbi:MAG: family 20 glycosylhydrolase [Actinomycetaceae bacterium]|nr:family 20 glycosylhydrolase [Actinomycetaceae bacterium]